MKRKHLVFNCPTQKENREHLLSKNSLKPITGGQRTFFFLRPYRLTETPTPAEPQEPYETLLSHLGETRWFRQQSFRPLQRRNRSYFHYQCP